MPFDPTTRNRLATFVRDARTVIADEFTQQFQALYGISPSGSITPLEQLTHLDEAGRAIAALLRERIDYLISSYPSEKNAAAAAVSRLAREQSFTILNRLAAIRMAEKRKLIVESVGKGYQSAGFRVYESVAGSGLGDAYHRYRFYLFCLFDELAVDLGILLDRRSASSLLFPRENALLRLLELLNAHDIEELWAEDETIGWIYQYFNGNEVKEMREAAKGGPPRNSRELAVRNQFFTPRYVVEFLTDNALGRLCYEMTKGNTGLKDQCRYLVRRPSEIFLKSGESAPESAAGNETEVGENLSQEELLRQPVHIPHRPLKDPREIRLLDPACGSMHFGLYAFDLFTVIYDEAWEIAHGPDDDAKSAETFASFVAFAATFPDKAAFLREVPRLIVERNIHGIDIDPRAAQIAGLSLWLRAQRAWHQAGVKPADRPRITRSNLVCAEPMPGEKVLLREFVEQQFPAGERPAFAFLLETIFDRMTLAGEAGSLLRIEEEIRTAIADAKRLWKQGPKAEQASLFAEPGEKAGQGEMRLDLSGITDEQFWERAEQRIYEALEAYAGQAENGGGFQRRLFADDAAQGFAFIDLCRKRYDVVVMNPPFGEASTRLVEYCDSTVPVWAGNLAAAFIARAAQLAPAQGRVGLICDHSIAVRSTYEAIRRQFLVETKQLDSWIKLGWEVLDANVETFCAVCQSGGITASGIIGIDLFEVNASRKGEKLLESVQDLEAGHEHSSCFKHATLGRLPNSVIDLTWPAFLIQAFGLFENLQQSGLEALVGHQLEADRHYRLFWEIDFTSAPLESREWTIAFKGGEYSPGYLPEFFVALTGRNWERIPASTANVLRNSAVQHRAGVGYGKRGEFVDAQPLRPSSIFTHEGFAFVLGSEAERWIILTLLNSHFFSFSINKYCGQHKTNGYVNLFAFPPLGRWRVEEIVQRSRNFVRTKTEWTVSEEYDYLFIAPSYLHLKIGSVETFHQGASSLRDREQCALSECNRLYEELNHEVYSAYGLSADAIAVCEEFCKRRPPIFLTELSLEADDKEKTREYVRQIISWIAGLVFGRWDIRYATGERPAPELPDPFAPLPVCPPGILQGDDGLPLSPEAGRRLQAEGCYPLDVAWDGILVDDPEHPLDLERRVHAALAVLWGDRADALEHEACTLLGVPTLREWFRRPTGFFADHLKRYSKSRRQAPIYWPLSTASGSYTLWLYYHRLTEQTLHTALADFLDPKLRSVQNQIRALKDNNGSRTKLEQLLDLEVELTEMRTEIDRIIRLPWKPNLNDGVRITASPLWQLFRFGPWRNCLQACWQELQDGDYDWAHLAYTLRPEQVRQKCKKDRSLAIAHGLESICEVEAPKPKAKRGKKAKAEPAEESPDFR